MDPTSGSLATFNAFGTAAEDDDVAGQADGSLAFATHCDIVVTSTIKASDLDTRDGVRPGSAAGNGSLIPLCLYPDSAAASVWLAALSWIESSLRGCLQLCVRVRVCVFACACTCTCVRVRVCVEWWGESTAYVRPRVRAPSKLTLPVICYYKRGFMTSSR